VSNTKESEVLVSFIKLIGFLSFIAGAILLCSTLLVEMHLALASVLQFAAILLVAAGFATLVFKLE